ncbi:MULTISPECIES: GNAT family N-acetyltransferase [unclassified Actinopolyspora]|uniref:GNAT family N-acetyltransferase n=1 Tax=unclassified Actinopolyspora TaxID=2639451 RepID=UPI0013F5C386|nr:MULTISPECIES: GNAT family N-acetyltransferase [unclassified Actinopolyspora]NHD16187.1 GNAT family N-acetyltransferase [Actinopolyspora sp. BKK2]NHE75950.1 GNAT family N-acetyltransferase [Actinopolyspora sp. BKK1]
MGPTESVPVERERLIERCAARAWPAAETVRSDSGWLLRATEHCSRRRGSSAVPPLDGGAVRGISAVEEFYRCRGAPVLVQVSPAHRHCGLDSELALRGYGAEAPTLVLCAELSGEVRRDSSREAECRVVLNARDPLWAECTAARGEVAAVQRTVDRIEPPTVFARAGEPEEPLGFGAAVLDGGLMGVFGMWTAPGRRGGGIASAVLNRLLDWGRRQGAHTAWLQVEESNPVALALYRRCGFGLSHRYHYRRSPE